MQRRRNPATIGSNGDYSWIKNEIKMNVLVDEMRIDIHKYMHTFSILYMDIARNMAFGGSNENIARLFISAIIL